MSYIIRKICLIRSSGNELNFKYTCSSTVLVKYLISVFHFSENVMPVCFDLYHQSFLSSLQVHAVKKVYLILID